MQTHESLITTLIHWTECPPKYTNAVNKQNDSQIRYKYTPAATVHLSCGMRSALSSSRSQHGLQIQLKREVPVQMHLSLNTTWNRSTPTYCCVPIHSTLARAFCFYCCCFCLTCLFMSAPFSTIEMMISGWTLPLTKSCRVIPAINLHDRRTEKWTVIS